MRDVGVGRSGGLTNWYLMNVADMWACVQDHQTEQHWRHVAGWRKVCDLAGQHLTRLRAYRDGLARAWPPETNAAAKAYVAELDDLIDQVQRTHDAASANQTALSAATQAITSTRTELGKIYEEYARKLQQKRTWETIAADPKAAAGSRAGEPPVTDAELERLNVRARGIMYGLSSELQQAQAMLRQPPVAPPTGKQPSDPNVYGGGTTAPVIPPIMPVALPHATSGSTVRRQSPRLAPTPSPKSPQIGPVLGDASPRPVLANPGEPNLRTPASPSSSTPPTSPQVPHGQLGSPIAGLRQPSQVAHPTGSGTKATHPVPPTQPRALPHGGLIGGIPGTGHFTSGTGSDQPRRVNPAGGLIGGGAAGTAPAGAAGSRPGSGKGFGTNQLVPPFGGSPGLAATGTRDKGPGGGSDSVGRRWDPDHPWQTDQGVNPVMRPLEDDGPIDPGPAIGLR
ncbi:hypothetical protein EG812_14880 [Verrucosispora sp. FIM060022]|nr:hypothetical protein [Verrucosispora sp. FIM060022]RUL92693.1 hypothetical protein EG812_14880 [Verrucosispora sp. FIM060022]